MGSDTTMFPKIDFRGLELSKAGTEAWDATRAKVMEALDTFRFFTVVFDGVSDEHLDELFTSVGDELYSAPLELKMKLLVPGQAQEGYIPVVEGSGYSFETLNIQAPHRLDSVQAFTDNLFPQGNPKIRDALWSYSKKSYELELIVRRMILEELGVVEHFSSFVESTVPELRFQKSGLPDNGSMVSLDTHKDTNLTSILYQHHKKGLEVLTKSGEWIYVPPKTYTFMTGELFEAWSNGRLRAVPHRVRMVSNGTRYSLIFGTNFKDGFTIDAPKELVNDENPKLFKPFDYLSYKHFYLSEDGAKTNEALKAFRRVNDVEIEA